jgi:epoxyqueuosine reductase
MPTSISQRTRWLKEAASRHGFMGVGISRAEQMDEEAKHLEEWLSKGYHGEMGYMANHFEMRVDPTKLVPGAKSVISLMYNYSPLPLNPDASTSLTQPWATAQQPGTSKHHKVFESEESPPPSKGVGGLSEDSHLPLTTHYSPFKISRYAFGEDYHKVVRRKLKALLHEMKTEFGDFYGRVFVDSAPVMERDWAKRSGLGWIGRNTLLIDPKSGSYFFLAEIILDVEFEYDHQMRDHCGTCTRCIDACPTDAISPEGYLLDGSKCISYLTIELKSAIPDEFKGKMEDWIFGCDICQEVCPWNRFSKPHEEPAFEMSNEIKSMSNKDWKEMTEEVFEELFSKSAIKRTGWKGMQRNIEFVRG